MRGDNENRSKALIEARLKRRMIYAPMHRRVDLRQTRSFDYRPEVRDESPGYRARNDICQNTK